MDYATTRGSNEGESPTNIADFRRLAKAQLRPDVFDYIDCGSCDEITNRANRCDLDDIRLLPLSLRDVSNVDLTVTLLGYTFDCPIGFSPTAFHKLVHQGGEISTASTARKANVPMIVSAMSSVALEDVATGSGNSNLWFQTYIFKDRGLTRSLVQRAEHSGYKAVVVTVGCPVPGKRDKNISNRFDLPEGVVAANFRRTDTVIYNNPIHSVHGAELDPSLTWRDVEWLCTTTDLPVLLKGIMNPADIVHALDLRISGVVLSNHGGRQLDTTESTIRMLPEMAAAVSGRIPLLIDGGFRRGTDIFKAVGLGADIVLLGRPVMWALAINGEHGLSDAVSILIEELRIAMQIAGCSSITEIRSNAHQIIRIGGR